MKQTIILTGLLLSCITSFTQNRIVTRSAAIGFYSKAPMENIEAINKTAISVLDITSGQVEFSALMKGFTFEKALMQEHFNENYIESDQYPKTVFKGKITDLSKVNFAKDGSYPVAVMGSLSLHGITKNINCNALITILKGAVEGNAEFNILLDDFKINIPSLVKDKIAKTIKITVRAQYLSL